MKSVDFIAENLIFQGENAMKLTTNNITQLLSELRSGAIAGEEAIECVTELLTHELSAQDREYCEVTCEGE